MIKKYKYVKTANVIGDFNNYMFFFIHFVDKYINVLAITIYKLINFVHVNLFLVINKLMFYILAVQKHTKTHYFNSVFFLILILL